MYVGKQNKGKRRLNRNFPSCLLWFCINGAAIQFGVSVYESLRLFRGSSSKAFELPLIREMPVDFIFHCYVPPAFGNSDSVV